MRRVWLMPVLLAIATLAGLLLALTGGEQPWRVLAWALLAAPLLVGGFHYLGPRGRRQAMRPSRASGSIAAPVPARSTPPD
jgi:hypothetical protein